MPSLRLAYFRITSIGPLFLGVTLIFMRGLLYAGTFRHRDFLLQISLAILWISSANEVEHLMTEVSDKNYFNFFLENFLEKNSLDFFEENDFFFWNYFQKEFFRKNKKNFLKRMKKFFLQTLNKTRKKFFYTSWILGTKLFFD